MAEKDDIEDASLGNVFDYKSGLNVDPENAAQFGDGGGGGGMEARIAKLESDVSHINGNVSELRADMKDVRDRLSGVGERMAAVEAEIRHLPSKTYMFTTAFASSIAIIGAISGLVVFADKLKSLLP